MAEPFYAEWYKLKGYIARFFFDWNRKNRKWEWIKNSTKILVYLMKEHFWHILMNEEILKSISSICWYDNWRLNFLPKRHQGWGFEELWILSIGYIRDGSSGLMGSGSLLYWWFFFGLPKTDDFLVYQTQKRVQKPLLWRKNWVTSTGGRHNLVPRLTMEHRGHAT